MAATDEEQAKPTASFTHTLILVEEVDFQHEEDRGFLPTLIQLSTSTKRPFVFISNGNIHY